MADNGPAGPSAGSTTVTPVTFNLSANTMRWEVPLSVLNERLDIACSSCVVISIVLQRAQQKSELESVSGMAEELRPKQVAAPSPPKSMAMAAIARKSRGGSCCTSCRTGGGCSGAAPARAATRSDEVLELQRLAGNAAVSAHLTHRWRPAASGGSGAVGASAHRSLQRLTAEQKAEDLRSERYAPDTRLQTAFDNSPTMKFGEEGDPVKLVQRGLVDDGFKLPASTKPDGTFDGVFGNETVGAVRGFQSKHGLVASNGFADGIVGHDTMGKLDQLAKGGGGGNNKPTGACADGTISDERDALPVVPPPSIKAVPGDDMMNELRKRPDRLPPHPPLGATFGDVTELKVITTRTAPDPAGTCVKCIAEWPLPQMATEILIATHSIAKGKRFWVTQPGDSRDCPTPFPKLKDVRAVIKPEALTKVLIGELEHAADLRRAFLLAFHRWAANVSRLSEARTHLRGKDGDDCRKKVEAFLNTHSEWPIPVQLDKMPRELFADDFISLRAGTKTRDEKAHDAIVKPPRPGVPIVRPSFDLARNPFGCGAFFRGSYDGTSLPEVPGAPSDIVVEERNAPPKRPWHSM